MTLFYYSMRDKKYTLCDIFLIKEVLVITYSQPYEKRYSIFGFLQKKEERRCFAMDIVSLQRDTPYLYTKK